MQEIMRLRLFQHDRRTAGKRCTGKKPWGANVVTGHTVSPFDLTLPIPIFRQAGGFGYLCCRLPAGIQGCYAWTGAL
jgi:hypothetical protein